MLIAQPVTLALQGRIIGRETRFLMRDLGAEALDLVRCGPAGFERPSAYLREVGAICFEPCQLALQSAAAPLELGPLGVSSRLPHSSNPVMVGRAVLMYERGLTVYRSRLSFAADSRFHGGRHSNSRALYLG